MGSEHNGSLARARISGHGFDFEGDLCATSVEKLAPFYGSGDIRAFIDVDEFKRFGFNVIQQCKPWVNEEDIMWDYLEFETLAGMIVSEICVKSIDGPGAAGVGSVNIKVWQNKAKEAISSFASNMDSADPPSEDSTTILEHSMMDSVNLAGGHIATSKTARFRIEGPNVVFDGELSKDVVSTIAPFYPKRTISRFDSAGDFKKFVWRFLEKEKPWLTENDMVWTFLSFEQMPLVISAELEIWNANTPEAVSKANFNIKVFQLSREELVGLSSNQEQSRIRKVFPFTKRRKEPLGNSKLL